MFEGGGKFLPGVRRFPKKHVGRRSVLRKRVLFLFLSLLLASAAALYTLNAIAPLPLPRPSLKNGSTLAYPAPSGASPPLQACTWP